MVHNLKELEVLMMHNRRFAAEIAHNVSALKRKEIVQRAAEVCAAALRAARVLGLRPWILRPTVSVSVDTQFDMWRPW